MKQETALTILKTGRNVFLTGAAGSGKTHVLNAYVEYLKERGIGIGITASTGIAATHLGGMTIHAWSGIGIKDYLSEYDLDAMGQRPYLVKRFDKAKVLIIDEVSMLAPSMLDMVDQVCREMKRDDRPFGGMQIVLSGDFFQLPPIVRGNDEIAFADSSDAWLNGDIRVCYLTEQHRHDDDSLSAILNDIRAGEISSQSEELLKGRINSTLSTSIEPTKLYTHNRAVDAENDKRLNKVKGEARTYEMTSKGRKNLVESLKKSVLTPPELHIKIGAVVMFVKNNFEEGYVNGTLGKVIAFSESGYPIVQTISGKQITAYRMVWDVIEDGKTLAAVEQVPLRLAWAITVHKSQGMSLDAAEIDLSQAFTPGQGYVALSRLRTLSGLSLNGINQAALAVHPYVSELDIILRRDSNKWDQIIGRLPEADVKGLHEDFVTRMGGTLDVHEMAENKKAADTPPEQRKSTINQTRVLLGKGLDLDAIVYERGLTKGTIIGHLEKLQLEDSSINLSACKPPREDLLAIHAVLKKKPDAKLTPIHRALKGRYTFEELRIARLFL